LSPSSFPLAAPPLRILFTACAPTDLAGLDYEKEEEAILRIADKLGSRVHLEIAEAGTFEELRELIAEHRPHIVHLSGHGSVRDGIGSLPLKMKAASSTRTMRVRSRRSSSPDRVCGWSS
jgi:hypothetical protein